MLYVLDAVADEADDEGVKLAHCTLSLYVHCSYDVSCILSYEHVIDAIHLNRPSFKAKHLSVFHDF